MLQLWVASACNSSFPIFLVATLLCQLGDCSKEQFHTFDSSQTVCTVTMQQSKNIALSPSNSNKALILLCLFCSEIGRKRDAILKKKKEITQWAWLLTEWLAQGGRKQEYKSLSIYVLFLASLLNLFLFFSIRWGSRMVLVCFLSVTWWAHKLGDVTPACLGTWQELDDL